MIARFLTHELDEDYGSYRARLTGLDEEGSVEHRLIYDRLYGDLTIIDTKVGALVQLVSIQAAIYALIISPSVGSSPFSDGWSLHDIALLIGAVATYLSLFLCISVLRLTWAGPSVETTRQAHAERLFGIRRGRTIRYRASWLAVSLGSALLALYLVTISVSHI